MSTFKSLEPVNLIWRKDLCTCDQGSWMRKSSWMMPVALNPLINVLLRGRRGRWRHKGEGCVTTQAEVGVMQPQAKGCQEMLKPPEAGRKKRHIVPRASWGRLATLTAGFGFRLPASDL